MRKLLAALAIALASFSVSAESPERELQVVAMDDALRDALRGAAIDCITTGVGLMVASEFLVEANPIGAVGTCVAKPVAIAALNRLPEPQRTRSLALVEAGWTAFGANNVVQGAAALIAKKTGSMSALKIGSIAGPIAAAITFYFVWKASERDRLIAEACENHYRIFPDAVRGTCRAVQAD
jgi:hypothetical protein